MHTPFHPDRLVTLDLHGIAQRALITEMIPLTTAIDSDQIERNTPVLMTKQGFAVVAFPTRGFSLYNVMQGTLDDAPWMGSFCAVCNAGMAFSPVVDGQTLDFYGAGYHDGMTVLRDIQTGSYWNHLTGDCMYGDMLGKTLVRVGSLIHSQAGTVARTYPKARFVPVPIDAVRAPLDNFAEAQRVAAEPVWLPPIVATITQADVRLPRFEMGLGVWSDAGARFYPVTSLHARDNLVFDTFDGARVLVYIDSDTATPSALFTEATAGAWRGDTLTLNDGLTIKDGILLRGAEVQQPRRPLQLVQRWYGFSTTFAGCAIYSGT